MSLQSRFIQMKTRSLINFILFLTILFLPISTSTTTCNQTCGEYNLHYPFGFSPGCKIQLNCTSNGTILAADFPVQSVTGDTILVNLPTKCDRPVESLHRLFTSNYAPTSDNAILLQNCTASSSACFIPRTTVQTHFELLNCNNQRNDSISCYSEMNKSFIDYPNLISTSRCRSLFSGISMESFVNSSMVSIDVQFLRLGWWLQGECRCSENAMCETVLPPIEGNTAAYRCQCVEGFQGDGFRDGLGCRKEVLGCNPSKYLSGQCGGITRVQVLIGGVVAGASLVIGLALIFCCIRKKTRLRSKSRESKQLSQTTGITIPIYSYKEMEKATDFFSDKRRLGIGAYGTVYLGKLNNKDWVAIKRIRNRNSDSIEQVINEVKLLSSVSHSNLVRLLGCCIEKEEQILLYEFMPNGTLSQHLHREKGGGLPWPVRLTIAVETAQAISYLHNAMNPPIYHRDIKSSNILLDHNYKSKLADFGLSRLGMIELSHISTAPQGTPGYLDPDYHQHFHLSDKSDVYSFGVVLIEIITASRVVDFSRCQNEVNLANLAVDRIGRGCLDEIIDPFLKPNLDSWTLLSVEKVAELAFRCLAFHRDMRPSMVEVAIELEQNRLCSLSDENKFNNQEFNSIGLIMSSTSSMDIGTDFSPVSVDDSWRSDQSSPSSNSLLNHVNR